MLTGQTRSLLGCHSWVRVNGEWQRRSGNSGGLAVGGRRRTQAALEVRGSSGATLGGFFFDAAGRGSVGGGQEIEGKLAAFRWDIFSGYGRQFVALQGAAAGCWE